MPGGTQVPVEQLLQWPAPNYIDPVTQPKHVLVFSCIIAPISIALPFARLYVRTRTHKNLDLDEWLMFASLFPTIVLTIIFPLVTEAYRFNRHIWDVELEYLPLQRRYVMAIYSLFALASGLIKMSVLLFYRRLSPSAVSPAFRWVLRITCGIIGIYTLAFTVIPIFSCSPVSAFWRQVDFRKQTEDFEYMCNNEGTQVVATGVLSTIQNVIVAILSTLLCRTLELPSRQKAALYSILAVSYTTVAIGAIRTYTGYRTFFETYDVTWVAYDTWLWSLLELHVGNICANAPALKDFFTRISSSDLRIIWTQHHSKPRSNWSKSADTPASNGAADSRARFWNKLPTWNKSSHSHDHSGCLFRARAHICADQHGGIAQMSAHYNTLADFQQNSMAKPLTPEYVDTVLRTHSQHSSCASEEDWYNVEINNFPSPPSNRRSVEQVMPPMTPPEPAFRSQSRSSSPFSLFGRSQRMSWDTRIKQSVWMPWEKKEVQEIVTDRPASKDEV